MVTVYTPEEDALEVLTSRLNAVEEVDEAVWDAVRVLDDHLKAIRTGELTVLTADDLSWGVCPEDDSGGPHIVSTSLCSGCLQYDPD